MNQIAHEEIRNNGNPVVYLLNAAVHKIPTQSSLIEPNFGFATSLNEVLDNQLDTIGFNINSCYTRICIFEGAQPELEMALQKVKKEMLSLIKSDDFDYIDEIHLGDCFLVWPIPEENKYLCILSSVNCNGLEERLEGRDLAEKNNIFFESLNMEFPIDFSAQSKKLFLGQRQKDILTGAGRLEEVWNLMSQLDRNTYEILQQKTKLLDNINEIQDSSILNGSYTKPPKLKI